MKCGKAEVVAIDPVTFIWKTINIGTSSRDEFSRRLQDSGMGVSDRADNMMKQDAFMVAPQEEQIDLANISVCELGFDRPPRYDAICARANKERGLELCSPETGPQLRLQYPNQPFYEWVVVAMEAIPGPDGSPNLFDLEHYEDGLWLSSHWGNPDSLWGLDCRFIFRVPTQPSDA